MQDQRIWGRCLLLGLLLSATMSAKASESIDISFQTPVQQKPLVNLSVELGGYDVSSFSATTDEGLVVTLNTDLAAGQYRAVVLAFYQDGEVQTLAEEIINIETGNQWSFNGTLSTSSRIAEEQSSSFRNIREQYTNGAVKASVSRQYGQLEASAEVEAIYDSNDQNSPDASEWSLPGYRAGLTHHGEYGDLGIYAGSTRVDQNNLLFSNYQRRGVSIAGGNADSSLRGSLFTLVSDVTNAPDNDLFAADSSNERTVGGQMSFRPSQQLEEGLIVGLGYVDGEGTAAGSGFTAVDSTTRYGGNAWNVSIDSLWLDRSLQFHLEYAESDFDSDGIGIGESATSDDAQIYSIRLDSNAGLATLGLDFWQADLQRQRVGREFYSIANLALPGDLLSDRFSFSGNRGAFAFTAEVSQQENNVDDEVNRATLGVDYAGLDVSYSPYVDTESGIWSVLGTPNISSYVHHTTNDQKAGDAQITGIDVDNDVFEYSVAVSGSLNAWSWVLSHTITELDDHSQAVFQNAVQVYTPAADNENALTVFQISWYPHERMTISPSLQWSTFEESSLGNEYTTFNVGLDTRFQLIPKKLFLNMNYFLNRNDNDFGNPVVVDTLTDNYTGNFQLLWKALQPRNTSPGADVFLNGSYGRQQGSSNDTENWQINIGFTFYWAGEGK